MHPGNGATGVLALVHQFTSALHSILLRIHRLPPPIPVDKNIRKHAPLDFLSRFVAGDHDAIHHRRISIDAHPYLFESRLAVKRRKMLHIPLDMLRLGKKNALRHGMNEIIRQDPPQSRSISSVQPLILQRKKGLAGGFRGPGSLKCVGLTRRKHGKQNQHREPAHRKTSPGRSV